MLWLDAFGTPKNPGGVSELSGTRREFLWLDAFGTPKNPGVVSEMR